MKKNRYTTVRLLAVFAGFGFACSCSNNNDLGSVSADYMKVADVVMSGNLTSTTFHIEADCSWRISEGVEWLTANPLQGSGSADVELTTGVNPSSVDERTCQFTVITDGGVQRKVTLVQERNNESMEVSTHTISFGESGGELAFTVTSNTHWVITGGADWLSTSVSEGTENGNVTVVAQANNTEYERKAVFTVTGNSGSAVQIDVAQIGKNVVLTIEPERIEATAKGREYSFQVLGNADWTVSADVTTWLSLDRRNGQNEGPVRITLTDNVTSEARTANIRVTSSSGRIERTCVISQQGATVPSLTQPVVSGVGRYVATISSTFTSSLDVSEAGFCYSTKPSPTVSERNVIAGQVEGQSGEITVQLDGLTSGQHYYVRAWVRNANGIGYSADATLTTEGSIPGEDENPTPNL